MCRCLILILTLSIFSILSILWSTTNSITNKELRGFMGKTTKRVTMANVQDDINLLTQNAIEEASIDGPEGMAAVTTVVLNRVHDKKRWGNNSSDVIMAPYQFSWTLEKHKVARTPEYYGEAWDKALAIVTETVERWVEDNNYLTNGADHYARTDWIKEGKVSWSDDPRLSDRGTVGHHSFFDDMPILEPDGVKKSVS